ncbi:MAG: hypothetical protein ABIL09_15245 [Gemmatimonadota bacterium]
MEIYYHFYHHLRTVRPSRFATEAEPPPEPVVFVFRADNETEGTGRGVEVAAHDLLDRRHLELRSESLALPPIEVDRHGHLGQRRGF